MYFVEMDHHVTMQKSSLQHPYNFYFKTFCRMLYIKQHTYIYIYKLNFGLECKWTFVMGPFSSFI
jgi:hypothetical protein